MSAPRSENRGYASAWLTDWKDSVSKTILFSQSFALAQDSKWTCKCLYMKMFPRPQYWQFWHVVQLTALCSFANYYGTKLLLVTADDRWPAFAIFVRGVFALMARYPGIAVWRQLRNDRPTSPTDQVEFLPWNSLRHAGELGRWENTVINSSHVMPIMCGRCCRHTGLLYERCDYFDFTTTTTTTLFVTFRPDGVYDLAYTLNSGSARISYVVDQR